MKELGEIPVVLSGDPFQNGFSGNTVPLLHEIRHALQRFLDAGEETIIDLQSLPMGSADAAQLLDALGPGEVEVRLTALGKSSIRETGIPGVWFIEHFNPESQCIGKFIEVTAVPEILKSQREDIQAGLDRLSEHLVGERR